jgi:demethylmenaquinone methyltransferase/2-methoxy-6-polyprenyl-1,4-benzoquinol methylase
MSKQFTSGYPLQDYYSRIYKTYDLVNRLFTFGLDRKWRRYTVDACLSGNPERILDLCCGTGDLAVSISRSATRPVRVTGFDLNPEMLALAREKAKKYASPEIDFVQGDAGSLPFNNHEFDSITLGFGFRNLTWKNPNRDVYLREISRVMKPGARLLILESAVPQSPLIGFFYRLFLRLFLVPLGGLISGDWGAYRYLAGSSSGFYDYMSLKSMLGPYKLELEQGRKFLFGSVNLLIATKQELNT